jgi:hypothetical protein
MPTIEEDNSAGMEGLEVIAHDPPPQSRRRWKRGKRHGATRGRSAHPRRE